MSNFSKKGTDEQTGSATVGGSTATTGSGDTIDWVLSYRNKTGSQADVNITDPITGNQTYVNGSLKAPPGFDGQWSTDGGATYDTNEPASGVSAVGAKGPSVDGSTGLQTLFTAPQQSFNAGNSQGDGWEALFIGGDIYNVHHHRAAGSAATLLDCHDKSTSQQCPGYTVAYVSPNAGDPFGTGLDILTNPTLTNSAVDADNQRIFVPMGIVGDTSIGVLCIDVNLRQSCGYTKLGDAETPNLNAAPGIGGGAQVGSKFYVIGESEDAPVYCYDMATLSKCAGADWPTAGVDSIPGYNPANPAAVNGNSLELYGGYLIGQAANDDGTRDLTCIDLAAQSRCPGFPKLNFTTGFAGVAPMLNGGGDVTGACIQTGMANVTTAYQCWSVTDGSAMGAPPYDQMVPNAGVGYSNLSAALKIGTRLYFDYIAGGTPNGPVTYTCYDFATDSACRGFIPVHGGTSVRPYTLRQDPYNLDCIWELGDAGVFQVFSATFGGSLGCNEGNAQVALTPADFYCDGGSHVTGWDRLRLSGVTSADYDAVAVTITDANGDPLPGWTNKVVPSTQVPIDISAIPYAGTTTTLNVQMVISWGGHPVLQGAAVDATFTGDDPQVCFKTNVGQATCTAQQIKDTANAVTSTAAGTGDAPDGNDSETATLALPGDPGVCPPLPAPKPGSWDLGIVKRALDSPVMPGHRVRYQLIVTNYGPDPAAPVTAIDRLPSGLSFVSADAGCTNAGGIVTCIIDQLAVGASHTFNITTRASSSLSHSVTNPAKVCSDQAGSPAPATCDPPAPCTSSKTCNGVSCQAAAAQAPTDAHPNLACARVPLAPRLQLTKVVSKTRVAPGGTVVFTLRVRNPSSITLRNVRTCDTLPAGLAYVSAKPRAKSSRGRQCWTVKRLAGHASRSYKITARALNGSRRKLVNHATATAANARPARAKRTVRVAPSGAVRAGGVTG